MKNTIIIISERHRQTCSEETVSLLYRVYGYLFHIELNAQRGRYITHFHMTSDLNRIRTTLVTEYLYKYSFFNECIKFFFKLVYIYIYLFICIYLFIWGYICIPFCNEQWAYKYFFFLNFSFIFSESIIIKN